MKQKPNRSQLQPAAAMKGKWIDYEFEEENVDSVPIPKGDHDRSLSLRGNPAIDCMPALISPLETICPVPLSCHPVWSKLLACALLDSRIATQAHLDAGGDPLDIPHMLGPEHLMRLHPDGEGGYQFQLMQRQSRLVDDTGKTIALALVPYGSKPGEHDPEIISYEDTSRPCPQWVRDMHEAYWETRSE